jgi:hypothetical protein
MTRKAGGIGSIKRQAIMQRHTGRAAGAVRQGEKGFRSIRVILSMEGLSSWLRISYHSNKKGDQTDRPKSWSTGAGYPARFASK